MFDWFHGLRRKQTLEITTAPAPKQPDNTAFNLDEAEKQHVAWLSSRKLCSKCEAIFRQLHCFDSSKGMDLNLRHHSIVGLQKSAQICPTCELLLRSLDSSVPGDLSHKDYITKAKGAGHIHAVSVNRHRYLVASEFRTNQKGSEIGALFECWSSCSRKETMESVNRSTDCDASWNLVQQWLSDCKECHEDCATQILERKLPTRLVFVGGDDSQLRLKLSRDLPKETKYLTLSHCWGRKKFATLSSENISRFLSNIPIESLTKTFKDAIMTTRMLGFQYIWIDSLCIKQDDDMKDWKHEAGLMEQVYANSSLNIAASDSTDGDTGCFFNRLTSEMLGWRVKSNKDPDLSRQNDPETHILDCMPMYWSSTRFENNPLGERAWVYQERFLSPRTLHLGAQELAWECRKRWATETFPDGFGSGFYTTPGCVTSSSWNKKSQSAITYSWRDIVQSYSAGKLSVPADKLVAISGVARLFASRFNTTYLAGLWKEDLIFQLLWYIDDKDRCKECCSGAARAPSWSWASKDSQVWIFSLHGLGVSKMLAAVDEVVMKATPDPFVDFNGGFVRIKASTFARGSIFNSKKPNTSTNFTAKILGKEERLALVYLDYQDHGVGDEVFYLPIAILKGVVEGFEPELRGLVLQTSTPGYFKRVGAFNVSASAKQITKFSKEPEHIFDSFLSALKQAGSLDSQLFETFSEVDEHDNRTYTVTII